MCDPGCLVVGTQTVAFCKAGIQKAVRLNPAVITAWGKVDDTRYLLSDAAGTVYVVVLKHDNYQVLTLVLEPLGITSSASTISYLNNGFAFIGSGTTLYCVHIYRVHRAPCGNSLTAHAGVRSQLERTPC